MYDSRHSFTLHSVHGAYLNHIMHCLQMRCVGALDRASQQLLLSRLIVLACCSV